MKIANKMMKCIAVLLVSISLAVFTPTFTTPAYAVTPPDRGLGAADSYGVFGKAGVTNDGTPTHIWGNVGADSSVTGLVDSQVGGTIITDGDTAGVATDASSTYDSLMSALQGTPATPTFDLAGTNTIGPGIYNVGASTLNGVLTLDGAGVYIFRSSSSETTAVSGTMNLINGACASNVFWAISTSMTIGTGAHIEGTIIAQTGSITFGTGATLVGRAISLTQQVTLLSNQITQPICAAAATPTPSYSGGSVSAPQAEVCPPFNYIAPIIIESKRIDADSVFISWGPYSGINTFIVQYGLENGKWLYSTRVTGFSTTLNALPANQPIWVEVAATDWCSIGRYGEAKLVGGPGLPSTGFAPRQNTIPWYIPAGIIVAMSGLLVSIQRKHI